jgi:hypothetical protein
VEKKLKFPTVIAIGQCFFEFTLDRGNLPNRPGFYYEHHWDILFDPWHKLIHKVHACGVTTAIAGRGFPRNKTCLYGDYGNGCTWIFDTDGDISVLSFDFEYGYDPTFLG